MAETGSDMKIRKVRSFNGFSSDGEYLVSGSSIIEEFSWAE